MPAHVTDAREAMQRPIADLMAWKLARYERDPKDKTVLVSDGVAAPA